MEQDLTEEQKAVTTQAVRTAEKLLDQREKQLLPILRDAQNVGDAAASITQQTLKAMGGRLPKEAVGPLLMFVVSDVAALAASKGVLEADEAFVQEAAAIAAESFGVR